ncbi:MAG: helix-turn-helix domain-containing protein [Maricaulaceae bacterium]
MSDIVESPTEPVRPIRALLRGLDALQALNRRDGLTVTEVAQATRLPRTTAYRILETLCAGGYVLRDEGDDRYRPTLQVRGLSEGVAEERWVREIARPEMERLCRRILWPVMLSTMSGGVMVLRATTDRMSPLALERYSPGATTPMTHGAAGVMWLGASPIAKRDTLLAVASANGASAADLSAARELADQAEASDHALDLRPVNGEACVAVPVRGEDGEMRAALSMRFIRSALTPERVVADFVPQLRETADRIGQAFGAVAQPRPVQSIRTSAAAFGA